MANLKHNYRKRKGCKDKAGPNGKEAEAHYPLVRQPHPCGLSNR